MVTSVRMAFLTGEAKDKEMIAPHARTVALLRRALSAWPDANIKFAFIEKLCFASPTGGRPTDAFARSRHLTSPRQRHQVHHRERSAAGASPRAVFQQPGKTTHDALARALARAMFPPPPAGSPPARAPLPGDENFADAPRRAVTRRRATPAPALPNVSAANPSLACVLAASPPAERQRRVVDRDLPHLIKLLSRRRTSSIRRLPRAPRRRRNRRSELRPARPRRFPFPSTVPSRIAWRRA